MLKPGEQIAERFEVESLLGEGGLAYVYRVRHTNLGTVHALKLLTMSHPSLVERLLQEGRIQAQLRHPNIVGVTDVINVNGQPGLLLEFVDCETLEASLARRGAWPIDEALDMFAAVLSGVASAHAAAVLHRDLKPANILLARTPDGMVPKVADFGIAKIALNAGSNPGITRAGAAMGTPGYMAPEQAEDATSVDVRADIFSLGAILYETLVGVRAYPSKSMRDTLNAMASGTFVPADQALPGLPRHLSEAITVALAPLPEARFESCEAFARALFVDDPMRMSVVLGSRVTPPPLPPSMWGKGAGWSPTPAGAVSGATSGRSAEPTMEVGVLGTDSGHTSDTLAPPPPARAGLSERAALVIGLSVGAGLALILLVLVGWWLERDQGSAGAQGPAQEIAPAKIDEVQAVLDPPPSTPAPGGPAPSPDPAVSGAKAAPTATVAPPIPRTSASSTAAKGAAPSVAAPADVEPEPSAPDPDPAAAKSKAPPPDFVPTVDEALAAQTSVAVAPIPDLRGTWSGAPWVITLLEQDGARVTGFIYRGLVGTRLPVTGTYDAERRSLRLEDASEARYVLSGTITGNGFKGSYTQGQGEVKTPFSARRGR